MNPLAPCRSVAGLLLLLLLSGCTAVVDVDKSKLGVRPVACVRNTTASCPCTDGTTSMQVCNAYLRYDPCQCNVPVGGGAGQAGN